jgi:uncharacterized protein YjiS (DUF1127 family)
LHKTQWCYAASSLQIGSGRAYLRINKENELKIESKTMNLIRNYRNWRRYRDTINELSRLSNRELSDLGIARGDIPFVARKSV